MLSGYIVCAILLGVTIFAIYENAPFRSTANAIHSVWTGECQLNCRRRRRQRYNGVVFNSEPEPDCFCTTCPCELIEDFIVFMNEIVGNSIIFSEDYLGHTDYNMCKWNVIKEKIENIQRIGTHQCMDFQVTNSNESSLYGKKKYTLTGENEKFIQKNEKLRSVSFLDETAIWLSESPSPTSAISVDIPLEEQDRKPPPSNPEQAASSSTPPLSNDNDLNRKSKDRSNISLRQRLSNLKKTSIPKIPEQAQALQRGGDSDSIPKIPEQAQALQRGVVSDTSPEHSIAREHKADTSTSLKDMEPRREQCPRCKEKGIRCIGQCPYSSK